MPLRLYNSLTKQEEEFAPLDQSGKAVTFYACGPTVYDYAHIGNFRSFLNADVLRRTLELLGYGVRQVMNMTDVGHMTDDDVADGSGEDKMEVAARRLAEAKKSGKLPAGSTVDPNDPYAIAQFYIDAFLEDSRTLGMKIVRDAGDNPTLMPRPTQYVEQMIALIKDLIERGHAYIASDGVVYFDVQSFPPYGRLSGNTPDKIRSGQGGRVVESTQQLKKHPADFMLWKADSKHLMKWPSPWGEGYPGWHVECSVMAMSLLGAETGGVIDLHSGGEDNIFPHHECEIAQSCAASGAEHFARHWFHTRFLIVEGEKMSKSKGNFFTVRDVLKRGASPAAIRLELIRTHYRSNANFTFQGLKDSQRQVERWKRLEQWLLAHRQIPLPADADAPLQTALDAFTQTLSNDLNVAGAIGVLNEAASQYDMSGEAKRGTGRALTYGNELDALRRMDSVLGVLDLETEVTSRDIVINLEPVKLKVIVLPPTVTITPGKPTMIDEVVVDGIVEQRNQARRDKDFHAADAIRDELLAMGIAIKDGPEGTTWSPVVQ